MKSMEDLVAQFIVLAQSKMDDPDTWWDTLDQDYVRDAASYALSQVAREIAGSAILVALEGAVSKSNNDYEGLVSSLEKMGKDLVGSADYGELQVNMIGSKSNLMYFDEQAGNIVFYDTSLSNDEKETVVVDPLCSFAIGMIKDIGGDTGRNPSLDNPGLGERSVKLYKHWLSGGDVRYLFNDELHTLTPASEVEDKFKTFKDILGFFREQGIEKKISFIDDVIGRSLSTT